MGDDVGRSDGSRRRTGPDRVSSELDDRVSPTGARRREADETSAREARSRLRKVGIIPVEPDRRIGVMLTQGEVLVAVRRGVSVDHPQRCPDGPRGVDGDLYVTTRRLVHLGRQSMTCDLERILEAVVAGDRLLLALDDGIGLAIAVDDPRLLRVEISAARAAARREARGGQDADAESVYTRTVDSGGRGQP